MDPLPVEMLSRDHTIHTAVNVNKLAWGECLSSAVLAFLRECNEDFVELLRKPVVRPLPLVDDLPLKQYFISSSHNTYLLAWQIFGRASAEAYTHVLRQNARCIEIDVWWSRTHAIPIVTHGRTLSQHIPFSDVCRAIGNGIPSRTAGAAQDNQVDMNEWPMLVSLECHVPLRHQEELVRIMDECWGEKLVRGEIEGISGERVSPRDLFGRIVLMVEYYPGEAIDEFKGDSVPNEADEDASIISFDTVSLNGDHVHDASGEKLDLETDTPSNHSKISDSLAQLGFYARSMKPPKNWFQEVFESPPHPPNLMINVSEPQMQSLIPTSLPNLVQNASYHLRRVYPSGLRLRSTNLDPLKQWRSGSHMACLNWQHYDDGMQFNEALFVGSNGWVVRPDSRNLGSGPRKRMRFRGHIIGLSSLPLPPDGHDFSGYCRGELFHDSEGGKQEWQSCKVQCEKTPADTANVTWNEAFSWDFEEDELAFFRLKVVRCHKLLKDEELAVFCVRLNQLVGGLSLVRLLDMHGKYTGATLLCNFTLECTEEDL